MLVHDVPWLCNMNCVRSKDAQGLSGPVSDEGLELKKIFSACPVLATKFTCAVEASDQALGMCYPPHPWASADNTNLNLDNSRYHAQPYPKIFN